MKQDFNLNWFTLTSRWSPIEFNDHFLKFSRSRVILYLFVCLLVCPRSPGRTSRKTWNVFRPTDQICPLVGTKVFWSKSVNGQGQGHENKVFRLFDDNFATIHRVMMRFFASDSSSKSTLGTYVSQSVLLYDVTLCRYVTSKVLITGQIKFLVKQHEVTYFSLWIKVTRSI